MSWARQFSKPTGAGLVVIGLGAGVQSSVMALLAACGEIEPMPQAAIFADTQWEPAEIYEHLDWLETKLPFPVYRVSKGNLRQDFIENATKPVGAGRFASMPLFTDGRGMAPRHCTKEYKVEPIERKLRELLGLRYRQRSPKMLAVEQWFGISTDELQRMKETGRPWVKARWPLIELDMSRKDCEAWFAKNYPGRKLSKSACIGCPYRSDALWKTMKQDAPEQWTDAVAFDDALRANGPLRRMKALQYLHASRRPLRDVELGSDGGQASLFGFEQECEGMCGV